jgi:hypothetical protein
MTGDPRLELEETFRRSIEMSLRFYGTLGQATFDYLKSLGGLWRDALPQLANPGPPLQTTAPTVPASTAPAARPAPAPAPVLVLEAETGGEARGVFLVANRLARRVSTPVVTSPFTDAGGREVDPARRVEPELVVLDPGEQALVEIVVFVGEELAAGTDYRAEISIPGLSDSRVPLVLRRRAAAPPPPPTPTTAPAPRKARRRKA